MYSLAYGLLLWQQWTLEPANTLTDRDLHLAPIGYDVTPNFVTSEISCSSGMQCHMTGQFMPDVLRQCDGLIFTCQKVISVSADIVWIFSVVLSVPAFYAIIIRGSHTGYLYMPVI